MKHAGIIVAFVLIYIVGIIVGMPSTDTTTMVPPDETVGVLTEQVQVAGELIETLQKTNDIQNMMIDFQSKEINKYRAILDTVAGADACVQELESMANGNSQIESVPMTDTLSTPRSRM